MRMLSQRRGGYVDGSIRHAPPKLKCYLKLKRRYVTLELSFAVTIAPILFYEDSPGRYPGEPLCAQNALFASNERRKTLCD